MAFQLHITNEAAAEINEAFLWYEDKLEGLGKRFFEEVEEKLQRIKDYPKNFAYIEEEIRNLYRDISLKRFPYRIVYRIEDLTVVVVAVFHMSLNPEKLRKRLS